MMGSESNVNLTSAYNNNNKVEVKPKKIVGICDNNQGELAYFMSGLDCM